MLLKKFIVKTSIADRKTGELTGVLVAVFTALNSESDESVSLQVLVELRRMTADVSKQVADLGAHLRIHVLDEAAQVRIGAARVDVLLLVFAQPGQLRYEAQCVYQQSHWLGRV